MSIAFGGAPKRGRERAKVVVFCAASLKLLHKTKAFLEEEGIVDPEIIFTSYSGVGEHGTAGGGGVCIVDAFKAATFLEDVYACGGEAASYFIFENCPSPFFEPARVAERVKADGKLAGYIVNDLDRSGVLDMLRVIGAPGARVVFGAFGHDFTPGPSMEYMMGPVPAELLPPQVESQRIVRTQKHSFSVFTLKAF